MNWFWMNIPAALVFLGLWSGISMWLVLKHPDRGPAPLAAESRCVMEIVRGELRRTAFFRGIISCRLSRLEVRERLLEHRTMVLLPVQRQLEARHRVLSPLRLRLADEAWVHVFDLVVLAVG